MKNQIDFAKIFKENRQRIGLSQRQMAKLIGVSQPTLGAIEENRAHPKSLILINAAYVFGYKSVDEFIKGYKIDKSMNNGEARLLHTYRSACGERRACVHFILEISEDLGK